MNKPNDAGPAIVALLKSISERLERHETLLHVMQREVLALGGAVTVHQQALAALTGQQPNQTLN